MTDIDTRPLLRSDDAAPATPSSVLAAHHAACVWPSRPAQRIAVITSRSASSAVVSAVREMLTGDQIVRWVEQGPHAHQTSDQTLSRSNDMTSWWEWADVVITEPRDESIADCVERGFVPVVAMTRRLRDPLGARRALQTVHPWSSRGLALQLCLTKPAPGVLQAAMGVRALPCASLHSVASNAA